MKSKLVGAYKEIKKQNQLSYTELVELSGLSRSQLTLIITRGAVGVSIDKMLDGLKELGVNVVISFEQEY